MIRAINLFILIVVIIMSVNVHASDVSYDSLPQLKVPAKKNPGVTYRLLEKSHQTILGLEILKNSLSDVAKHFGNTTQAPMEGFTHGEGICISSSRSNDQTKIVFVKIPVADLHGFVLFTGKSSIKPPNHCKPSEAVHKDIATLSGIRLGMTKEEMMKIFGKPYSKTNNNLQYRFEIRRKFRPREWFEKYRAENKDADPEDLYTYVRTDLKIEFRDDKIVAYTVSTTDTY